MNDEKPTFPFALATFGDAATHYQLRYPRLNDDGSIHLVPEDGHEVITVPVKSALHYYMTFPTGVTLAHSLNSIGREKNSTMLHHLELLVTDARIVLHYADSKYPGKRGVAQLWYPWVAGVGFRPKQNFLNGAALNVEYREDFPLADRGMWWERLELLFDKTYHPGGLAQEIAHRICSHHLKHGAPEQAKPFLEEMLDAELKDDPSKGEFSTYYAPAYVGFPGGVPYIEAQEVIEWEWTLQSGVAKEEDTASEVELLPSSTESGNEDPSSTPDVPAETVEQDVHTESSMNTPVGLPRIGLRDRLSGAKELAAAHRAFVAELYEEAAEKYDSVTARLASGARIFGPAQLADLFERAAAAHSSAGNVEKAVLYYQRALEVETQERDESLELTTREYLAETLAEVRHHELLIPNLERIAELADAHRSRTERAETHERIGLEYVRIENFEPAAREFSIARDLHEATNNLESAANTAANETRARYSYGDIDGARVSWQRALKIFQQAEIQGNDLADRHKNLLRALDALMRNEQNAEQKLCLQEDAVAIARDLRKELPNAVEGSWILTTYLQDLSQTLQTADPSRASLLFGEVITLTEWVVKNAPPAALSRARRRLAINQLSLAELHLASGEDRGHAQQLFDVVREDMRDLSGKTPDDLMAWRILLEALLQRGAGLREADLQWATELYEEALNAARQLVNRGNSDSIDNLCVLDRGINLLAGVIEISQPQRAADLRSESGKLRTHIDTLRSSQHEAFEGVGITGS